MTSKDLIQAFYTAALRLGLDADTSASWAGLCVAIAVRGKWGEA